MIAPIHSVTAPMEPLYVLTGNRVKLLPLGLSATGLGNKINWRDCTWYAKGACAQCGFYTNYCNANFFIDGMIGGGACWQSVQRSINFHTVARTACSKPINEQLALYLQSGITKWQSILPCIQAAYIFNKQKGCSECGAESLNFYIPHYATHTIHAKAGIYLQHAFEHPRVNVVPRIQLAWAGDFFLRPHRVCAKLTDPTNCLSICDMPQCTNYFDGSIDINFVGKKCSMLRAYYEVQVKDNFTAQMLYLVLHVAF